MHVMTIKAGGEEEEEEEDATQGMKCMGNRMVSSSGLLGEEVRSE